MGSNDWMVPIEFMVGSLDQGEVQACSICRIPDELREPKREAYVPKLVSVGPLHRGATRQLVLMEEPKWRYLKEFLERQGSSQESVSLGSRLRFCGSDILNLESVICACYGGDLELGAHEISKIMMVDGCFLLEFLLRLDDYLNLRPEERDRKYSEDPFLATEKKVVSVLNDIAMMENQIPFVVLKKLYRKVYRDGSEMKGDHRVANLVRRTFGYPPHNDSGTAHILHLMHSSTVEQGRQIQKGVRPACKELKRCATRLLAAGISIIPAGRRNGNTGEIRSSLEKSGVRNEKAISSSFGIDLPTWRSTSVRGHEGRGATPFWALNAKLAVHFTCYWASKVDLALLRLILFYLYNF
ncbi:uncharacterized protein [Arachis hypogaea]|uniref:uncharacterized protein n=1 Tax=Arachis hypogaea TaxID=3818 RepID=UPI003B211EFA|nr:UPF0481 protein [Arachis hypogaea]